MNEPAAESPSSPPPPAATDSPWFWLLLFCGMGCLALLAISPRYATRQQQIEHKYQMREHVRIQKATPQPDPDADAFEPGQHLIVTLRPVFAVCAALCTVAAIAFAWQRRRNRTDHPV